MPFLEVDLKIHKKQKYFKINLNKFESVITHTTFFHHTNFN